MANHNSNETINNNWYSFLVIIDRLPKRTYEASSNEIVKTKPSIKYRIGSKYRENLDLLLICETGIVQRCQLFTNIKEMAMVFLYDSFPRINGSYFFLVIRNKISKIVSVVVHDNFSYLFYIFKI